MRNSRKKNPNQEPKEAESLPETPKYNLALYWKDEQNRAPLKRARELYFKEYTYEAIFLKTGVPPSIFLARRKNWDKMISRVDFKIIENIRKKAVSEQSKEFIEKGLQIGLKLVNRLVKREEEISVKDWKLISDSIMAIHRIHQLELGKPTDISMYEKMSPEQMNAYLLEIQRQAGEKHEMSMFAPTGDVPEEELLAEYNRNDEDSSIN